MRSMYINIVVLIFCSHCVFSAPVIKVNELLEAVSKQDFSAISQKYQKVLVRYASKVKLPLSSEELVKLRRFLDQYQFINIAMVTDSSGKQALYKWLVLNYPQLSMLVQAISPDDDFMEVMNCVDKLCVFDRSGRKEFFPLIVAVSIVWDQQRGKIHGQMGRKTVPYKDQKITDLYNYFRKLYSSNKSAVRFNALRIEELIFVVDTPVPVSELEWALKNERGNASSWGKKYSSIEYDTPRLDANEMSWPSYNGDYSLENIEEFGGICVDQAYYATMTARAHGIPAMYFGGQGKRGGHAWFGHFVREGKWITDVGQYGGDNYATGYTKNPQTNKRMTDHDVEFACERKLRRKSYSNALVYSRAAEILLELDSKPSAYRFASMAIKEAPLCVAGWEIKEKILTDIKKDHNLLSLYKAKRAVFKDYPDVSAEAQLQYAKILERNGKAEEAAKVRKKIIRKDGKGRIDIEINSALAQFDSLVEHKKRDEAIKVIEKLIWDNREERSIVFRAMSRYLDYTKKVGLEEEAVRFIKRVYSRIEKKCSSLEVDSLMMIMVRAYENAGDLKGVAKVNKQLAELSEDKRRSTEKNRKKEKRRGEGDDSYKH